MTLPSASGCLAAVFDGVAGHIALQTLPVPEPRGAEILVRVLGCTLCGSDIHSFEGRRHVPVPTILGHEIVGEIAAFGETATRSDFIGNDLRLGDRVTWAVVANCGDCAMCRHGLPQKCLHAFKYGHEAFRSGRELSGGLAEYCLLVPGTAVVRLPSDLPLAVACPASCATATIVAAMDAAGPLQNRRLCLFGAGLLGLTACAIAQVNGADEIVCVDPVSSRRGLALRCGATRVAAPDEFAAVADSTVGTSGFDVILELSGQSAAFHTAWPRIRTGGVLVLVGSVFPAPPVPVELEHIVRRQLTIRGIHNYAPRHLVNAVAFLSAHHHRFPLEDFVAEWFPLKSVAEAFARSRNSELIRIGVSAEERPG